MKKYFKRLKQAWTRAALAAAAAGPQKPFPQHLETAARVIVSLLIPAAIGMYMFGSNQAMAEPAEGNSANLYTIEYRVKIFARDGKVEKWYEISGTLRHVDLAGRKPLEVVSAAVVQRCEANNLVPLVNRKTGEYLIERLARSKVTVERDRDDKDEIDKAADKAGQSIDKAEKAVDKAGKAVGKAAEVADRVVELFGGQGKK